MSLPAIPRRIIKGRVYHKPKGRSYAYGCNPAAIRRAAKKYDGIDLDIRYSKDGTAWCCHQANPTKRDGWADPAGKINDRHAIVDLHDKDIARLRYKGQPIMTARRAMILCKQAGLIPCFEDKTYRGQSEEWWRGFREMADDLGVTPIVMSLPGTHSVPGTNKLRAAHDGGLLTMWLWRTGSRIPPFVDLVKSHRGKGGIYRKSKTPIAAAVKPAPKPKPAPPKEPAVTRGMLTDLDVAARKSGLRVVELPGWKTNRSGGGEAYRGVGIHHTGSYDALTDAKNDLDYAKWMAFEGRADLDPPLMNLALSAECVVYVGAAGNANGMGQVKASGPMPAARDGNALYLVIEAMNSGTQGWESVGRDADGNPITQREAYHRLCAALCAHYGWDADVVRAHYETSVTGKWDPGDPKGVLFKGHRVMDMREFRAEVARLITNPTAQKDWFDMASEADLRKIVRAEIDAALGDVVTVPPNETASYIDGAGKGQKVQLTSALTRMWRHLIDLKESK